MVLTWAVAGQRQCGVPVSDRDSPLITAHRHATGTHTAAGGSMFQIMLRIEWRVCPCGTERDIVVPFDPTPR